MFVSRAEIIAIIVGVIAMCCALLIIVFYSTIKTDSAVGQFEQKLNQREAIEALPMRMVKK
ncbi:MAG: hypothetical protein KAS66_13245 [Candidatus Omnitrophica bacterium]|nr:hypothetical protein [Candidatus Omnitrophota bacterium]